MRLRCIDGKVRRFKVAALHATGFFVEARCLECGYEFGVHDTKRLKPRFRQHICNNNWEK